jgi:hypothetical protein
MDDFGEVIVFLVIAGLILYGIIMLIILLIPFIISGVLIYFEGKKFRSQMGKYQLSSTSKLTLAAIGAASLCLSAILALWGHYPGYMIIPFSVIGFLTLSIVTLGLWAAIKLYPLQNYIEGMKRERNKLNRELTRIGRELSAKNRLKGKLANTFASELEKRERIEGQLRDFCMSSDHPRVFISLKERIEREARELSVEKIRSLLAALHNPHKPKERREAVELCVLELEKLGKENHNIHQRVDECVCKIERIGQEKEAKERTISDLNEVIREKENALQLYKSQKIVLN